MARSIHTTRRDLEEAKRQQFTDEKHRETHIEQLNESLAKKQRVKKHSATDRRDKPIVGHTLPEQIPISIVDTGPFIHYPASPDDILAVLKLLPAGVLDGLNAIELRLGAEEQGETDMLGSLLDRDPYVGRRSFTLIPGVYHGRCLGSYFPDKSAIRLLAYVYDAKLPDREMWEWYMRFFALGTLMHELSHHYDYANRIARGRWRGDDKEHVEHYAESNAYCWTRDIVIPYLENAYYCQTQQFAAWLQHHGGVAMPLSSLIVKSSPMRNGERTYTINDAFFSMSSAIESLADVVANGQPVQETRLRFARDFHYREEFETALQIIDKLLSEYPGDLPTLTLQADIYAHQERYADAEQVATKVIVADARYGDAWEVLATVYEHTRQPEKLFQAISQIIKIVVKKRRLPSILVFQRALAKLWLGDLRGYRANIKLLEKRKRPPLYLLKRLREEEERQLAVQQERL